MSKKVYYRYNPATDGYERVYPTRAQELWGKARHVLFASMTCTVIVAAIYYMWETPREKITGVDSLAIAIGTSHGAYKFKPGTNPQLRFDILAEIEKRIPEFPIVLHGASSVPQEFVKIINEHGGALKDAIGVPEEQLRQAARSAVCKINIDSDLRLAMTAGIREVMWTNPAAFDPREYLKVGRANVKTIVAHKIKDVLGSEGKA